VPRARGRHEPEYDADRAALSGELQLELDLLEEQIIADPDRAYQRPYGPDGVIYDLSAYDRFDLIVAYTRDGYDFTFVRVISTHE